MTFFNSGLFWFIEGVLTCLSVVGFKLWMDDRGVKLCWWKWALTVLWTGFTAFVIAFVGVNIGDGEPQAARLGALIFGVLAMVSGAVLWRLLNLNSNIGK